MQVFGPIRDVATAPLIDLVSTMYRDGQLHKMITPRGEMFL